jgi:predicted metalloprotease with PDZ domain
MRVPLCLALLGLSLSAQQPVRYELSFPNAAHHEAEIKATFSGVRQPVLELVMSTSSPGRYAIHEFAKNVYNVRATDGQGHSLETIKAAPSRWNVSGHKGTVVVEYTVFGDRADGTYNGIDATHAHLNMPATIMWAHGFEKLPVWLKFGIPEGSNWKVATQLLPSEGGAWTAPTLDRLMDSPAELSAHDWNEWQSGDARFRVSLHHKGTPEEASAYARMCEAVVLEEEGVFGSFPKYDNGTYTFLLDYLPYVNGDGMEHRDSTVITGTRDIHDSAVQLIGTVAHEFFHSWNVKRIRPKSLEPFDYEHADMSGELWFAEGFTNYYGPLALQRAGLTNLDRFTRSMSGAISQVLTAPGRKVHTIVEMSRMAPFVDAATANDPTNYANTFISYYTYGQALALGIDLAIRENFPGKSLDDWMKAMWREHPDADRPYTLEDLQKTLAEATGDKSFAADIFQRHIYAKEPMPYEELLARAGFSLDKRRGATPWIGNQNLNFSGRGVEIMTATMRDSPLYNAGLDRGDRILQWDGKSPANQQELNAILESHKAGDRIHLRVETRSGRKELDLTLAEAPQLEMVPYELAGKELTPGMAAFRQSWLDNRALRPLPHLVKYCPVCKRTWTFDYERCPYDGGSLQITLPKPGDEKAVSETDDAPAAGRGGRGSRGGR